MGDVGIIGAWKNGVALSLAGSAHDFASQRQAVGNSSTDDRYPPMGHPSDA